MESTPTPKESCATDFAQWLDEVASTQVAGRTADVPDGSQINMIFTGLFARRYRRCCRNNALFTNSASTHVGTLALDSGPEGPYLCCSVMGILRNFGAFRRIDADFR